MSIGKHLFQDTDIAFLVSSCLTASDQGTKLLRYSCSFPCYLRCDSLATCFHFVFPDFRDPRVKWYMVSGDLVHCGSFVALVFKGKLALLGFAALSLLS